MRVAIVQSNYLPWRGYFDMIAAVDVFVLYDVVQFTRRDWRNRNLIKTEKGPSWITIPVKSKGRFHQTIDQVTVTDPSWPVRHISAIDNAYRGAPHHAYLRSELYPVLRSLEGEARLSSINERLLRQVCDLLSITTPLVPCPRVPLGGDRSERLAAICEALGARTYVSGGAARSYLDESVFADRSIAVEWFDYEGFPEYPQIHGAFEPAVSIVDVLAHLGPGARAALRH